MREPHTQNQSAALISSAELAKFLGVPISTVYAWQSRGGGPPAYRVGRHTRYRPDEVLAWLDRKRRPEAVVG
jgi:excisionase family DNA binding protein